MGRVDNHLVFRGLHRIFPERKKEIFSGKKVLDPRAGAHKLHIAGMGPGRKILPVVNGTNNLVF